MLNKFFLTILSIIISTNSFALETNELPDITVTPVSLTIREPFTALAIANIQITNNTDEPIKIKKLSSNQARHVGIYQKKLNDFGAEQMKRAKNILIPAKQTTEFNLDEFQIMFTGLEHKYLPGEEVDLTLEFELQDQLYTTYLSVHANYY